jgi:hypothetical protein
MSTSEIPAMIDLDFDHNIDSLAKHAGLENARAVVAVNNAMAEVQHAAALHWSARARRADAVAGLIRAVTVMLVVLAIGWSVWSWVKW